MASIILEVPDWLLEKAKRKGILSSDEYESFLRDRLLELKDDDSEYPPGFPPELKGMVNPAIYGKGEITGNIIGPFYEEWGMKPPAAPPVIEALELAGR